VEEGEPIKFEVFRASDGICLTVKEVLLSAFIIRGLLAIKLTILAPWPNLELLAYMEGWANDPFLGLTFLFDWVGGFAAELLLSWKSISRVPELFLDMPSLLIE